MNYKQYSAIITQLIKVRSVIPTDSNSLTIDHFKQRLKSNIKSQLNVIKIYQETFEIKYLLTDIINIDISKNIQIKIYYLIFFFLVKTEVENLLLTRRLIYFLVHLLSKYLEKKPTCRGIIKMM